MTFIQHYNSPLGGILLAADEIGLTGLWFNGQKYFARSLPAGYTEQNTPALSEAKRWLEVYFTGCMGNSLANSLRKNHNLRRDCATAHQKTKAS